MIVQNFMSGVRVAAPAVIASAPFGLLVGAMAVDHGMTVGEAVMMSAVLFAGASQVVGIELFAGGVAPWLVILSIVAVNFRMVLYSAGLTPYVSRWHTLRKAVAFHLLTDFQYAEVERRADLGLPVSFSWYMGIGLAVFLTWIVEAWIGALFGQMVENPAALGIHFLVPIYFLGLVMSFRTRPLWLPIICASGVISYLAYVWLGSPWHITSGALAGVAVGAILSPEARQVKEEAGSIDV